MSEVRVQLGATRQVWFADTPDADLADKRSFIVRDDAYSVQSAQAGRSVRLGEPINLGPDSTWFQKTWEGGSDQDVWLDEAMYQDGTADTYSLRGKVQLHRGFKAVGADVDRDNFGGYTLCSGGYGIMLEGFVHAPLFVGQTVWPLPTGILPSGADYALISFNPVDDSAAVLKDDFGGPITALHMAVADIEGTGWLNIGLGGAANEMWVFHPLLTPDGPTQDMSYSSAIGVQPNSIISYGDSVYYLSGNSLWKRKLTGDPLVTHSVVKTILSADECAGITVWNNRIWFGAVTGGWASQIYQSDGVNTTQAFKMHEGFLVESIIEHYGSLYILGRQWHLHSSVNLGSTMEVWRYTGSTLSLLYSEGDLDPSPDNFHMGGTLASYGRLLVWGRAGGTNFTNPKTLAEDTNVGLMYYDAELDAVLRGPSLVTPAAGAFVTSVQPWGGAVAASFYDPTDYSGDGGPNTVTMVAVLQNKAVKHDLTLVNTAIGAYSFNTQVTDATGYVLSSIYDGTIPAEPKVWLTGRVALKLPTEFTQCVIAVILDGDVDNEITVATVVATDDIKTRNVTFALVDDDGAYLRSTTLQYKYYLLNTEEDVLSEDTPEVDSLAVNFTPAPAKRRQWSIRATCQNAQERLDGSDNPLATAVSQGDALEAVWSDHGPTYFWPPSASGDEPLEADAIPVTTSAFTRTSYRVDTQSEATMEEVALTLLEVVV